MDFSNLAAAFNSFVETIRQKPIAALLGVSLIALIYIGFTDPKRVLDLADRFVSRVVEPDKIIEPIAVPIPPEEEAKRLQESIPRDKLTCAAIDEVGKQLDADRVTFWTFSNGSYGLGGVPFNYANVHCPYVKEGIAYIPEDFQKIPNSISAETNSVLFPNAEATECGYWQRDALGSPYLRAGMKSLGSVEMAQCGVRDRRGIPIGKIVVSWREHDPDRNLPAIIKTLKLTGEAIGRFNTPTISIPDLSKP